MGKLISQLERIANSDLALTFKGSEILISEHDKMVHIATTGRGTGRTGIDFTYHEPSDTKGLYHVRMLKIEGSICTVLLSQKMDKSNSYPYLKIHQNPVDLEGHSVATVPTQDYVNRVKELKAESQK